jgi:fructokinase
MPARKRTVVSFGEILWDLLPTGPVLGGAPFNFACRMADLGEEAVMVSRLGRDALGDRAFDGIAELGVRTECVQRDPLKKTGMVPVKLDARGVPDFTILPDVAYDYIEPAPEALRAAREADCLCYGTIGWRAPVSRATLGRLQEEFRGAHRLLDVNLRKDCWTPDGVRALVERSDILKLNDNELEEVARAFGLHAGGVPEKASALLERTGISCVVVTLGEHGAFALSRSGQAVYSRGFRTLLVDTVGSGDAFAAGFIHVLMDGGGLADACAFGNALGAIVAGQRGATQPVPRSDVERVLREGGRGPADPRFAGL